MSLPGTAAKGGALIALLSLLAACGDKPKTPDSPDDVASDHVAAPRPKGGSSNVPTIDAEVGALDAEAVEAAFSNARPAIMDCVKAANQGLDFEVIGGDMEVEIRVGSDGGVKWAFPRKSTMGHRGAELCILDVLRDQSWPKPEGGEDGIARTRFGLDAPAARPPLQWSAGELGGKGASLGDKLQSCKSSSGANSLEVTLYVDADGNVIAAGASTEDETGIDALDCAANATKGLKLPSPGSYPAKVTIGS
jgi:hypothetical protein